MFHSGGRSVIEHGKGPARTESHLALQCQKGLLAAVAFVHVAMKPLEWFFVLVLYTFDRHPERRIAVQYLSVNERRCIADQLSERP